MIDDKFKAAALLAIDTWESMTPSVLRRIGLSPEERDNYGLVPLVGPLPRGRLLLRFARVGTYDQDEPVETYPMILRPLDDGGWEVESINVHRGGAGPED